jgi:ABC-type phosphate/phosphonate transport system substrate-binding protein
MIHMARISVLVLLTLTSLAFDRLVAVEAAELMRVGIVRSLFRDIPESSWGFGMRLFRPLMRAQTGLETELESPTEPETLAEALLNKKTDLGIFQGIEFAWERQKHPELRPLVILINFHPGRESHLLVRQDSTATAWCNLKGKTLAVPLQSREHAYVYLDKQCRQCGGQNPEQFFKKISRSNTIEDALDDVIDGQVAAALVDDIGLEAYRRRKPGRSAKLKELCESEAFPDTVVAYRARALDKSTLKRCREGLLRAHQTLDGRMLLMFWKVTSFRPVPADFDRMLTEIARKYPAPQNDERKVISH